MIHHIKKKKGRIHMAKKYYGNYTAKTWKALSGSKRIWCSVDAENNIYVSNGYLIFKMTRWEYESTVRAVVCRDPGNWCVEPSDTGYQVTGAVKDMGAVFEEMVKPVSACDPLRSCRLQLKLEKEKTIAAAFYSASPSFATFLNTVYLESVAGFAVLKAASALSAVVAYSGEEPFAVLLPIRAQPEASRAVQAWFAEA